MNEIPVNIKYNFHEWELFLVVSDNEVYYQCSGENYFSGPSSQMRLTADEARLIKAYNELSEKIIQEKRVYATHKK